MPNSQNPGEAVKLQVQLNAGADVPSYYVNYVNVSHGPYDFTLSATKIPSPLSSEQMEALKSGKPIEIEALLQITVPPALIEGLIKALTEQQQMYAKELLLSGTTNDQRQ